MSTPPDRLEPFELLKLMHAQRLDFTHAQVGELLAEVERLRGALVKAHVYCGCPCEVGTNPVTEYCFICAALRGDTEGGEG